MFYYIHLTRPPPEQAHPSQPILITPNIANDLRTEYPSPGEKGIDIYYAWVKCIESQAGVEQEGSSGKRKRRYGLGPMTQLQKLVTWKGNSYKEVQVFPPKEAVQGRGGGGVGSRWQLLLCTRSSGTSPTSAHARKQGTGTGIGTGEGLGSYLTSIDLSAENFGDCVFPILSAPVLFHVITGSTTGRQVGSGLRSHGTTTKGREVEKKQVWNERLFKLPSSPWKSSSVGPLKVMEHLSYDLDKEESLG